ncbi:hypothetical protein [Paenibacillus naphthalenovorans]|uniref:hypothetical protein n=1 Tax=Paenibacillus naphthalenovorans TaxID=162209 RepID=UPI003D29DA20
MLQAWDVKRKRLVNVLRMSETGAIISYSPVDQPGLIFLPLIENGRNVEPYEILQDVQLSMEF